MVETQQTAGRGMPGENDTARFLRDLRQLRDYAGLGQAELAARAHYPREHITAAEIGPAAPDLPLLSAYVRGCGGTVEDWEERWRALTNTPALPLASARSAGCSTAASAGARIGSISPAADIPDPAVIMAALNRVAEKIAASTPSSRPPRSSLSPISPFSTAQASTAQASTAKPSTRQPPVAQSSMGAHGGTGTAAAAAKPAGRGATTSIKPTAAAGGAGGAAGASAATGTSVTTGTSAITGTSVTTATSAATGTTKESRVSAAAAKRVAVGRRFGLTSRTTVAALVALAICVIAAVLAIFA
jgi:DNA-binding XRE family transcriptional regulator